jgi:hypothetical protein
VSALVLTLQIAVGFDGQVEKRSISQAAVPSGNFGLNQGLVGCLPCRAGKPTNFDRRMLMKKKDVNSYLDRPLAACEINMSG